MNELKTQEEENFNNQKEINSLKEQIEDIKSKTATEERRKVQMESTPKFINI